MNFGALFAFFCGFLRDCALFAAFSAKNVKSHQNSKKSCRLTGPRRNQYKSVYTHRCNLKSPPPSIFDSNMQKKMQKSTPKSAKIQKNPPAQKTCRKTCRMPKKTENAAKNARPATRRAPRPQPATQRQPRWKQKCQKCCFFNGKSSFFSKMMFFHWFLNVFCPPLAIPPGGLPAWLAVGGGPKGGPSFQGGQFLTL